VSIKFSVAAMLALELHIDHAFARMERLSVGDYKVYAADPHAKSTSLLRLVPACVSSFNSRWVLYAMQYLQGEEAEDARKASR
jgi:hypothetical protein